MTLLQLAKEVQGLHAAFCHNRVPGYRGVQQVYC